MPKDAKESRHPPQLSVIMPVYNEAGTVLASLERVLATGLDMEVIVVDDGSTDGTAEGLAGVDDTRVRVLREPANRGKGWAVRRGIALSKGEAVIVQDADLEYDPHDFRILLDAMRGEGVSVVYGNRLHPGNPRCSHRRYLWGGMLVTMVANMLYGAGLHDEPVCYKLFEGRLLRSINLRSVGFEFCPEVTAIVRRLGYRIAERPVRYEPRTIRQGKKIRWTDGVLALWTLLKCRFVTKRSLTKRPERAQGRSDGAPADGAKTG